MKIYNHHKLVTQICMFTQQKNCTELRLLSLSAQDVFPEKKLKNKTNNFYICCAGGQVKVCMQKSEENSYDSSHTSSS